MAGVVGEGLLGRREAERLQTIADQRAARGVALAARGAAIECRVGERGDLGLQARGIVGFVVGVGRRREDQAEHADERDERMIELERMTGAIVLATMIDGGQPA